MEAQCQNNQPHSPNESNICIVCGADLKPHIHDYIVGDGQGNRSCLCGEPMPQASTELVKEPAQEIVQETPQVEQTVSDPNRDADTGQFVEGNDASKSNSGGRPTVMTPEVLEKLRQAFLIGCTDIEACLAANISRATLNNYQNANPDFLDKKEEWKQNPLLKARNTIYNNLDDKDMARWYAERKNKDEFSSRSEITGKDGAELPPVRIEYVVPTDPIKPDQTASSADQIPGNSETTPSVVVVDGSINE